MRSDRLFIDFVGLDFNWYDLSVLVLIFGYICCIVKYIYIYKNCLFEFIDCLEYNYIYIFVI